MIFENAVNIILRFEGGYTEGKNDPGGETKYGISKRAYPDLNIARLTVADAVDIYRRDYWDTMQLDRLPKTIRLALFDAAVNHGTGRAAKMIQEIVGAKADGVIGPKSILAIKVAMDTRLPVRIVRDFLKERAMLYVALPHFKHFGSHWMQRLIEVAIYTGEEIEKHRR